MSDLIYRVFLDNEADLVNDIIHQLKQSTSRHYMALEWDVLLRRVESMVAYFLISLRGTPDQFVRYASEMAEERIAEGYSINEILMVLGILEEKSWAIIVEGMPREGQVRCLSRVTGTIGAVKEKLPGIYVAHLEKLEQEAAVR